MSIAPRTAGPDPVDLLVVGGGIHGLFAAYDAATRGLRVALVERGDFGSGLSFNHQRTIHGGLRALPHGRLGAVRRQVIERRVWAQMAPHLIDPLPFLLGTYGWTTRSRLALGLGLACYDRVGAARNRGVPDRLRLPPSSLVSRARTVEAFPSIQTRGLTGGAVWYDYQLRHPDRFNWLVAHAAMRAGGTLTSYTPAVAPLTSRGAVVGMRVRDALVGRETEIPARVTLLAGGGVLTSLLDASGGRRPPPVVRAVNLLLDRPAPPMALAAPGPAGRVLTVVPWRGLALAGTFQSETFVRADADHVDAAAVAEAVDAVRQAFPHLEADAAAIRLVHHGLTPAVQVGSRAELLPASRILGVGDGLPPGLVAIVGAKFTTARQTAEQAIDRIQEALGRTIAPCTTATVTLPHAGPVEPAAGAPGVALPQDVLAHLLDWYGTEAADVAAWAATHDGLSRLADDTQVLAGEVDYAVAHAQARTLADVVLRRTDLGGLGHPGRPALHAAANRMGRQLGWSAEHRADQIAEVERRYPQGAVPPARRTPSS